MKQNLGSADRIVRVLLAAVVAILYFTDQITGTAALVLGLLAVVFIATSAIGFCPLYAPFKLSTKKSEGKA
jgi:Na+(H+)/acetate symporter ActP